MPLSVKTNISALRALGTRQAASADNIANAATPKFKRVSVEMEEGRAGSVRARTQKVNTPGVMINNPDSSLEELSNVDLGQELTDMIPTRNGYGANIKALKAEGEMEDSVLDLIG